MSDQPILEVKEVTKTFGGILALNRVSFHVNEGEILGIIGPNGSGKTTLINCITAFIKMTSGKVLFRGKDISSKPAHKIADMGVTRTFQIMRPYYSLPAYKNLVIPLFSPRAKRTGGWRGGGKLGDRNTVGIDILEEIGFERDSFVPYKMASTLPTDLLATQVETMAGFLQNQLGVVKGDRVLLYMQNSPQFVVGYYAILRADAVVVPVNPMSRHAELEHFARDTGANVAIFEKNLT